RGTRPGRPRRFSSPLEHGHRRNGPDAEAIAQLGDLVGVHLHDEVPAGVPGRDARDFGRDHPARTAPRRPEIDDNRERGRGDERVERDGVAHLDRLGGGGEGRVTLAAAILAAETIVAEPVLLAARRAGKYDPGMIKDRGAQATIMALLACRGLGAERGCWGQSVPGAGCGSSLPSTPSQHPAPSTLFLFSRTRPAPRGRSGGFAGVVPGARGCPPTRGSRRTPPA